MSEVPIDKSWLFELVHKSVRLHQRATDDGYPIVLDVQLLAVVCTVDGIPIYVVVEATGCQPLIVPWHSVLSIEPW